MGRTDVSALAAHNANGADIAADPMIACYVSGQLGDCHSGLTAPNIR